ncbi:uncharacterized protein C22orf15 homolog isoform X3 [Ictidomys tridecemlineatus]|uniref:uncharacterized protein C22orf15 homolog isoform X3 n=1 Tax=Ictidomys tridecemlineatus TaxID=43179 RepID=UPI001A9D04F9|nr:uncharacterized protein C22orf15 homolog isoform X3 [Ictidomys tridecemlineatus]XP_040145228.1 uncharacterized protein C22orf15 homolog isoform X3 [Ictidomys tridecemlineatus]
MFVTVMFGVIHICQDGWMSAKKFMQNCLDYCAWAGCGELVNPWCSLTALTAHLKQRGQVPPDASLHAFPETIALLAEDGQLVSLGEDLEEKTSPASSKGSPLLQERGTYVLVKIIRGEDGAPTRYESLLENLDDQCPELAGKCQGRTLGGKAFLLPQSHHQGFLGLSEELRWLSGVPTMGNGRRRRMSTRRSHRELEPPSRAGRVSSLPSRTR